MVSCGNCEVHSIGSGASGLCGGGRRERKHARAQARLRVKLLARLLQLCFRADRMLPGMVAVACNLPETTDLALWSAQGDLFRDPHRVVDKDSEVGIQAAWLACGERYRSSGQPVDPEPRHSRCCTIKVSVSALREVVLLHRSFACGCIAR